MADTAVKQLLDTINDLRHRVEILEMRSNNPEPPRYWREDTMASAVAVHWTYTDLWEAPIIAETEEWATITLTNWWPRTAREAAEEALIRVNTDIRNQYITTWATVRDNIVLDYSAIRNAPNAVTHIQSASDALIVDFADWQRQFIPLHISRQWMM